MANIDIIARGMAQKVKSDISNIPNQYRSKSIKLELSDISDDVKNTFNGTGTIPPDNSVTPTKTTFINVSKNLIDANNVFDGTVDNNNGTITNTPSTYSRSGYIKIVSGQTYRIEKPTASTLGWFRIAWYNSSKVFISGSQLSSSTNIITNLVSPVNAEYCVINVMGVADYLKRVYFFGLATDEFCWYDDIYINDAYVSKDIKTAEFTSVNSNLYDYKSSHSGYLINFNDNTFGNTFDAIMSLSETINAGGYYQSDLIPVEFGQTYSFWYTNLVAKTILRISFFDRNKKFIKYIANNATSTTIDNSHIKYISIGNPITYLDTIMVVKGITVPTEFKKYKKTININDDYPILYKDIFGWNNKKFCSYGDSITAVGFWQDKIKNFFMFNTHYLRGISGSTVSSGNTSQCWINADGSTYGSVAQYPEQPVGTTAIGSYFCNPDRIATIPTDSDLILVMGGTNDKSTNVPIGDVTYDATNGFNTLTFKGGLCSVITQIQQRCPHAIIVILTLLSGEGDSTNNGTGYTTNSLGLTSLDYAKSAIEVAQYLSVPYIDVFGKTGINPFNRSLYMRDGLHPTYNGVPTDSSYTGSDQISRVVIDGLKGISAKF